MGRDNDREDYKHSDLFNNWQHYVGNDEYILADGGFMSGPNLLVPIHQTVIDKQTDPEGREAMVNYTSSTRVYC